MKTPEELAAIEQKQREEELKNRSAQDDVSPKPAEENTADANVKRPEIIPGTPLEPENQQSLEKPPLSFWERLMNWLFNKTDEGEDKSVQESPESSDKSAETDALGQPIKGEENREAETHPKSEQNSNNANPASLGAEEIKPAPKKEEPTNLLNPLHQAEIDAKNQQQSSNQEVAPEEESGSGESNAEGDKDKTPPEPDKNKLDKK